MFLSQRQSGNLDRDQFVQASIDRIQFLHGDPLSRHRDIRPPWSIDETAFLDQCDRCGECIKACPARIIASGSGGYPRIDFTRGHCTFCGDCVKACEPHALAFSEDPATPPWRLGIDVKATCLSLNGVVCRSCGDICDEQAIRFRLQTGGRSQPQPDPLACTGCGACVAACPNHSIAIWPVIDTRAAASPEREEIAHP